MSRDLCVCVPFLTNEVRSVIEAKALPLGITPHFFTSAQQEEAKACVKDCEILYSQFPSVLKAASPSLKWFCAATAGVDVYCSDPSLFPSDSCLLTNSNCFGVTIAEHTVMVSLMLLRQMPAYQPLLDAHQWPSPFPIRSIRGSRFTILGTGNIGFNVAARLRGMNAGHILGLSRSGKAVEGFDEVLPISALNDVLPRTDILIMALPGTPETYHILNAERIALLPRTSYVINVGRGSAVDQVALAEALNNDVIAGAALDVAEKEPVPAEDPLWNAKNMILTPHISGNTSLAYTCQLNVEMFCTDLENYVNGRPLNGLVDRSLGY